MLYADNPAWSDVVPVPQYDEGSNPMAPILYSQEYKDATDYFRGIVKIGEKSARVLELTEHIIQLNPAHYSVWQYRYETLLALNADLKAELLLMDDIASTHMKTYQVWHHRRLLVQQLNAPIPELAFIADTLDIDPKNYHTWAYRQWLLAHFNDDAMWSGELPYVEEMLSNDVRNNSAWHHRFFVVWMNGVRKGDENREEALRRELNFVKSKISLAPNNDSAWNYLRGLLNHTHTSFSSLRDFVIPYTTPHAISTQPELVLDLENPPPSLTSELPCPAAVEFLADIHEEDGTEESVKTARLLYRQLADELDKIRKSYWEHRGREAAVGM
ncbi:protein prenylyltransferase [Ramaria rubella]|nr:protein prenylyltransferase [Ramaria rubella]